MAVMNVSINDLREAFDLVLAQWPDEVTPGEKSFHLGGGCNMRELNRTHQSVEDWALGAELEGVLGEIIGSVEHYVFICIHSALKNLTILRVEDLDFNAFCSRFDAHPSYRVIKA